METLQDTPRLTPFEKQQAAAYTSGEWSQLSYDDLTGVETWIRRDGNKLHVRELIRQELVDQMMDQNSIARSQWTSWSDKRHKEGALVASIPIPIHRQMMRECGWQNGDYDRAKYRRMLNDMDNAKFRLVDGRI